MKARETVSTSCGRGKAEGEAGSPLSREPDAGLGPRTPRSRPEPKADTSLMEPHRRPSNGKNFKELYIDLRTDLWGEH